MGATGESSSRGSAVVVHGLWSNPEDWRWVREVLESQNVHVVAPDLPSHRSPSAGRLADAEEVRRAIRACHPPVVLVGWSYGGSVISVAGRDEGSVVRLVYVASVPDPAGPAAGTGWIEQDPHVIIRDGMHALDNDWWLNEEAGRTFPPHVVEHLRRHPRRPASLQTETDPQIHAAWQTKPVTVLLGERDELVPDVQRQWARQQFDDVRVIDCDHFILFRQPAVVAEVVLEVMLSGA